MLLTIALLIVILGLLIFVHELGHFSTAKKLGIKVDEFGFGYPPRMFGIQKISTKTTEHKIKLSFKDKWRIIKGKKIPEDDNPNTIYSVNWLPLGGFVKIKGEQGDNREDADSFSNKKIWQRAIVLSSGVAMNFILAVIIISIGFIIGLPSILDEQLPASAKTDNQRLQIIEVMKDSPAEEADFKTGDVIKLINNEEIDTTKDFQNYTKPRLNQKLTITITRGDEIIKKNVIPEDLNKNGEGIIGVYLAETALVSYPWYYAIWMGAKTTVQITWEIMKAVFDIIIGLITSQESRIGEVAGPVGIAVLTGQVAKLGFIYILQFTAILSINLAILNFIPFPALDGGRFLFLIIEKIKGSPINQKVENLVHSIGFFILIGLVILVTFRDISRFSDTFKQFIGNIF